MPKAPEGYKLLIDFSGVGFKIDGNSEMEFKLSDESFNKFVERVKANPFKPGTIFSKKIMIRGPKGIKLKFKVTVFIIPDQAVADKQ